LKQNRGHPPILSPLILTIIAKKRNTLEIERKQNRRTPTPSCTNPETINKSHNTNDGETSQLILPEELVLLIINYQNQSTRSIYNLPFNLSPLSGTRIGEASHPGPPHVEPGHTSITEDMDTSQGHSAFLTPPKPPPPTQRKCSPETPQQFQEEGEQAEEEDDNEESESDGENEEISFERRSEKAALEGMLSLDSSMRTVGDKLALQGYNSTIVCNAGGGLNPFTKNPNKLISDQRYPVPHNKLEYAANLITARVVDKIYFTEARVTHDIGDKIGKYLKKRYPHVRMVFVPMSEHTKTAFDKESTTTPKSDEDHGEFSGCLALMHASWWNRLVNKRPRNETAGRSMELIFSHDGLEHDPDNYLVDLLVYAVSGNKAISGVGLSTTKALNEWIVRKLGDHTRNKSRVTLLGDFNAAQFKTDRESGKLRREDEHPLSIHQTLKMFVPSIMFYANTSRGYRTKTYTTTAKQDAKSLIDYIVMSKNMGSFNLSTGTIINPSLSCTHLPHLYSLTENPFPASQTNRNHEEARTTPTTTL